MFNGAPDGLPVRRLIGVGVAIVVALTAAFTYAALSFRSSGDSGQPVVLSPAHSSGLDDQVSGGIATDGLPSLESAAQPEEFARIVAGGLFDWTTTNSVQLAAHVERLAAVGDPSGESVPGLVADIRNYLPTDEAWRLLRSYSTRQWIDVDSVEVPTLWTQALAEAGPDGLAAGTTAITVTGTRHRAGVWEGQPVTSAHEVTFTVFMVCGPTYPECHLLRLSRLDEPLD